MAVEAVPFGKVDFGFRAVNYGLPERDGKANRGVIDLIVIGIVIHKPSEIVCVQPEVPEEDLGQTHFVIISL